MRWANKYMWYVFNCRFRFSIIHTLRQHKAAKQKSLLIWCNRTVLVHLMLVFSSAMKSWHQLEIIIIIINVVVVVVAHLNIQRLIEFPSVNAYSFCAMFFLLFFFHCLLMRVHRDFFSNKLSAHVIHRINRSRMLSCVSGARNALSHTKLKLKLFNAAAERERERTFRNENAPKP